MIWLLIGMAMDGLATLVLGIALSLTLANPVMPHLAPGALHHPLAAVRLAASHWIIRHKKNPPGFRALRRLGHAPSLRSMPEPARIRVDGGSDHAHRRRSRPAKTISSED